MVSDDAVTGEVVLIIVEGKRSIVTTMASFAAGGGGISVVSSISRRSSLFAFREITHVLEPPQKGWR